MMDENAGHAPARARFLARLEHYYLAAMRAAVLALASLLLLYAGWLVVSGLFKVVQDAASVKEAPAVVAAEELADLPADAATNASAETPASDNGAKRYYAEFARRYHALYRDKFERFRKKDDTRLALDAFDAQFIRSGERLQAIREGSLTLEEDRRALDGLIGVMAQAATLKKTEDRLRAYNRAVKKRTTRTVRSTRTERYCDYYGYYINECISYGTRQVPVTRTVTDVRLPDGILTPRALFARYQDRYLSLMDERRTSNATKAREERERITIGNAEGQGRLWTAVQVVGGFMVVMFLFLMIALERHQRRIAAALATRGTAEVA